MVGYFVFDCVYFVGVGFDIFVDVGGQFVWVNCVLQFGIGGSGVQVG